MSKNSKANSHFDSLVRIMLGFKKTIFFLFGLSLFLIPGQGYYKTLQVDQRSPVVRMAPLKISQPSAYPINISGRLQPNITAKSFLILDRDSAVVMAEKNSSQQLLPASTVKIMTALVALDHYQPNDVLTGNNLRHQGQVMEIGQGERLTFLSLLYGLLVSSANDAAEVLAQNYPGGKSNFVAMMNQKARKLNLFGTYYSNPSGLNDDWEGNLLAGLSITTSLDLARLSLEALKNPLFAKVVSTQKTTVFDITGQSAHQLYNINQLLGRVEGVKGIKTGWTEDAQECLVTYVERNGRRVVLVVLGSQDRFGETNILIDWVFENFQWEELDLLATAAKHR
ncbi:D-alanyl-D-alanine carboxypeptidase family protein [Patescibacteria group bacterium]